MLNDDQVIRASVQRVSIPAPDEGLYLLATAVLCNQRSPALHAALQAAAEIHHRSTQATIALRRRAEDLRVELAQIEHQLTG